MQYDFIGFIAAILIAGGGAYGYFKSAIGAYLNSRSGSPPKPLLEFCVLLILAGLMGYRWYNGSFVPAGIVTCIAAGAFVINMFIYYDDLHAQLF
ncbi:transmembrane protein 14 homolog [Contarinia nasturtii]|uniref:transmembrane protein 14 homolog n=1 Tax=Contarinia nasturtii TaxID=265458 RepID=UPI0012D41FDD|nr:transmembrane protein 14 homolog [Contarinia nasturtii]